MSAHRRRTRVGMAWAVSVGAHAVFLSVLALAGRHVEVRSRFLADPEPTLAIPVEAEAADYSITLCDIPPRPRTKPVTSPPAPPPTVAATPAPSPGPPTAPAPTTDVGAPQVTSPPGPARPAPPAEVPFHQPLAAGQSIVYVLDRSGSMGEAGQLARARRRLAAALRGLPPGVRFQVVAYNARPQLIAGVEPTLVTATDASVALAASRVAALAPEGSSDHFAALGQALRLKPDAVFWLSDGGDLRREQAQSLTALNAGRSCVHAVVFGKGGAARAPPTVRQLTDANRGTVTVSP